MSMLTKSLLGLALVFPMAAYVIGSMVASADEPTPRETIVIQDGEPRPPDTVNPSQDEIKRDDREGRGDDDDDGDDDNDTDDGVAAVPAQPEDVNQTDDGRGGGAGSPGGGGAGDDTDDDNDDDGGDDDSENGDD